MKLNAWLKQNPASSERLQVVERLAQALNTVHDRGEPLAALDPEHVDVGGDGDCDISAARRGNPAPGYCAPERAEGGPPSPEADIYAAGAIAWEVLSGRPYAAAPSHLAEAARDVPRDLADAVMACLEQSPQWRPRDLTYIAQLAQHTLGKGPREQSGSRPASARATARPASSRAAAPRSGRTTSARTSARPASPIRTTPLHEPRSHALLAVLAAAVVALAGGGYYWMTRDKGTPAATAPTTVAPAALSVTARPEMPPATPATPPPVAVASAPPLTVAPAPVATPFPTPFPTPTPASTAVAVRPPTPLPPPVTLARALPPPVTQPPLTEIRRAPTPPPAVIPAPTTTTTTVAAAPAGPRETPVLSTVSPPSVRRPGKFLLDLRGTGLRADLRVRVVPLKEAPHGITIVRQVCKSPNLFQVLIDLDPEVTPGGYAVTLADASGGQTAALTFTVTK